MPLDTLQASSQALERAGSRSLLIEGWRGVNHSFAMVNQHQILELLGIDGLSLFHTDMPFAFPHWDRTINRAGFSPTDQQRIDGVPEPGDASIDHVYRIVSPFQAPSPSRAAKTTSFMITELGLSATSFAGGVGRATAFTDDGNRIVTSSAWSRDRIVEYGFSDEKVHVIPLGVDTVSFHPLEAAERDACRARLGIRQDETVFLNIGVALWNKGIDILLTAFARLRGRGRRARLILKDQRDVYGVSVEGMIRSLAATMPELAEPGTLSAISVVPGNLDRARLRALYGVADCYVSPYRAEGFNLPVIEAIACGTPVIVTRGGATDDFCDDAVACRIAGRAGIHDSSGKDFIGRYIEPDGDALIDAMDGFVTGAGIDRAGFERSRGDLLARFTWRHAARELAALALGTPAPNGKDAANVPDPASEHPRSVSNAREVHQADILRLLGLMRPAALAEGGKARVGDPADGGYVIPAMALACDTVVSIGIGTNVSFDLHFAELGAAVLQFDHTIGEPPVAHPNFAFHSLGWGPRTEGRFIALRDITARLGASPPSRRLLKFDIEGGEYDIFDTLAADELAAFEVIVCELHHLSRLDRGTVHDQVHRCLTKLTRHHAPIHLHANNYGGLAVLAGVPVPDVMEISLLRRDLNTFAGFSTDPIPGPLDRPNHPGRPDLCLTAFGAAPCA